MRTQVLSLLALSCLIAPTVARAAEPIVLPVSTASSLPLYNESDLAWAGFYAGVHGGITNDETRTSPVLGAQLGVNAQFDFYLVGAEVAVRGIQGNTGSDSGAYAQILGRAGLVTPDDVLIYTAAGYGLDLSANTNQGVLVGGGVEIPLSESISVGAQYLRSIPTNGAEPSNLITFGANWHF